MTFQETGPRLFRVKTPYDSAWESGQTESKLDLVLDGRRLRVRRRMRQFLRSGPKSDLPPWRETAMSLLCGPGERVRRAGRKFTFVIPRNSR